MPAAPGLAPVTSAPFGFRPWYALNANTTNYSVLLSDSGTLFTTSGGSAVTFTLPALASGAGGVWFFYNTQDQNMIVTAPANKLIADGNLTGTTATWSTASHKIGSFGVVFMNDAGTFYVLVNGGGTTVTVT